MGMQLLASLALIFSSTNSAPFIPVALHQSVEEGGWSARLEPYMAKTRLSDFVILVDLPPIVPVRDRQRPAPLPGTGRNTSENPGYRLSLLRDKAVLFQKDIIVGPHAPVPFALAIPYFLTLTNNNLTLHIQTSGHTQPSVPDKRAPSALLVPKGDPLFRRHIGKTPFLLDMHVPGGHLQPFLKKTALSANLILVVFLIIPVIIIIRIRFLIFLKKHFQ